MRLRMLLLFNESAGAGFVGKRIFIISSARENESAGADTKQVDCLIGLLFFEPGTGISNFYNQLGP